MIISIWNKLRYITKEMTLKQDVRPTLSRCLAVKTAMFLFYGFVLFVISGAELPELPDQSFSARKYFWEEQRRFFPDLGEAFAPFAPYLPRTGTLSFITDTPYDPYSLDIAKNFSAQAYFTPLVLNPYPQEKYALFHCSTEEGLATRLRETGYRLLVTLAPGKGLAEKVS